MDCEYTEAALVYIASCLELGVDKWSLLATHCPSSPDEMRPSGALARTVTSQRLAALLSGAKCGLAESMFTGIPDGDKGDAICASSDARPMV